MCTVKPLLRDPSREQPPANLALAGHLTCKLTSFERPPVLKGHFAVAFGVASKMRFHCIY